MKNRNLFLGSVIIIALAGCKFEGSQSTKSAQLGPTGTPKPGFYEISRRFGNGDETRVDVMDITADDPSGQVSKYTMQAWRDLKPDIGGTSLNDDKLSCQLDEPGVGGTSFSTSGYCDIVGTNQETKYKVSGRTAVDGFEIIFDRSGDYVPADQKRTVYTARWTRAN